MAVVEEVMVVVVCCSIDRVVAGLAGAMGWQADACTWCAPANLVDGCVRWSLPPERRGVRCCWHVHVVGALLASGM